MGARTDFVATSFDADTTRAIGVAFDMACRSLQLSDIADPLTSIVASKILIPRGQASMMRFACTKR